MLSLISPLNAEIFAEHIGTCYTMIYPLNTHSKYLDIGTISKGYYLWSNAELQQIGEEFAGYVDGPEPKSRGGNFA